MSEKRFVAHDTLVEDYVESLGKQKRKREDEARCEIVGRIFEKSKERQVRSAHHRVNRIKQVSC